MKRRKMKVMDEVELWPVWKRKAYVFYHAVVGGLDIPIWLEGGELRYGPCSLKDQQFIEGNKELLKRAVCIFGGIPQEIQSGAQGVKV